MHCSNPGHIESAPLTDCGQKEPIMQLMLCPAHGLRRSRQSRGSVSICAVTRACQSRPPQHQPSRGPSQSAHTPPLLHSIAPIRVNNSFAPTRRSDLRPCTQASPANIESGIIGSAKQALVNSDAGKPLDVTIWGQSSRHLPHQLPYAIIRMQWHPNTV